ncbi:GNAT family N-acetyltransferase [Burkholderia glumae]
MPTVGYLGAWHEEIFCGFFMIREVSKLDIEIHACLLPEAVALSRVLGVEVLQMLFNASPIQRVSAPIIGDLVSAQNYVRKLGFKQEGVLRKACSRKGTLLDVVLFGITREDFGERHEFCNKRDR